MLCVSPLRLLLSWLESQFSDCPITVDWFWQFKAIATGDSLDSVEIKPPPTLKMPFTKIIETAITRLI